MKKRSLCIAMAVIIALAGITACGSSSSSSSSGSTAATEAAKEEAAEASDTAADTDTGTQAVDPTDLDYWANLQPDDVVTWANPNGYKRVGMVVPDGTSEFYVEMCTTAEKIFEDAGYTFVWTGAGDSESAINAVEAWTGQGLDALILLVQDTACENVALQAMKQNVLVVLGSATFSSYHVWCCQDYYQIGWDVAEMAVPDMKEKFGDDASYILLGGTIAEFQQQKTSGLRDGMAELYPGGTCYEIIDSSDYQSDTETLLIQHPEIQAIVSWHASMTLASLAAVQTLGLNNPETFAIYGSQMTTQSQAEIADPNSCYVSDTWMGDQGRQYANVVLTLLNGGSVNHWDYAQDFVVNADNVDSYYDDYYEEYGDTYVW